MTKRELAKGRRLYEAARVKTDALGQIGSRAAIEAWEDWIDAHEGDLLAAAERGMKRPAS